jgi:hypothetical protein
MVVGSQLLAFFLFLGYDCWQLQDRGLLSLFLFSHMRSLFFSLFFLFSEQ